MSVLPVAGSWWFTRRLRHRTRALRGLRRGQDHAGEPGNEDRKLEAQPFVLGVPQQATTANGQPPPRNPASTAARLSTARWQSRSMAR